MFFLLPFISFHPSHLFMYFSPLLKILSTFPIYLFPPPRPRWPRGASCGRPFLRLGSWPSPGGKTRPGKSRRRAGSAWRKWPWEEGGGGIGGGRFGKGVGGEARGVCCSFNGGFPSVRNEEGEESWRSRRRFVGRGGEVGEKTYDRQGKGFGRRGGEGERVQLALNATIWIKLQFTFFFPFLSLRSIRCFETQSKCTSTWHTQTDKQAPEDKVSQVQQARFSYYIYNKSRKVEQVFLTALSIA